ncbi:hypothetical protein [Scytonema sp. PCC 10023]
MVNLIDTVNGSILIPESASNRGFVPLDISGLDKNLATALGTSVVRRRW